MSTVQLWTLAVVCAATAILMLDIAVVNTALPSIAADLHTGIGGLQWVVDAYTLALASVVLTAGSPGGRLGPPSSGPRARCPPASAAGACSPPGSSSSPPPRRGAPPPGRSACSRRPGP